MILLACWWLRLKCQLEEASPSPTKRLKVDVVAKMLGRTKGGIYLHTFALNWVAQAQDVMAQGKLMGAALVEILSASRTIARGDSALF